MKRINHTVAALTAALAALTAALAAEFAALTVTLPAQAATTSPACGQPAGSFQNDDEKTRVPAPGPDGLTFGPTDLIHFSVDLDVADLLPGSYVANPAPDQPSFFSVEVSGPDGKYGTLRWNSAGNFWEATSQGMQKYDVNPKTLADAFPIHLSHHVITAGVGYTVTPPGAGGVVVSLMKFDGKTYDLKCHPVTTTSPAPTKTTVKPSHTTSHSASRSPAAGAVAGGGTTGTGALAITGPRTNLAIGIGGLLLAAGVGAFVAAYRRKTRFTA